MTTRQIDNTHMLPGICRTHPSVCVWGDKRIMSYRLETDPPNHNSRVALCYCDEQWNPIPGSSRILDVPLSKNSYGQEVLEDCRLIQVPNDKFTNSLKFYATNRDHVCCGFLGSDLRHVTLEWYSKEQPPQKNWTAWINKGELCWHSWPTDNRVPDTWEYGIPHGGTPLIPFYHWHVGFFHSYIDGPDLPPPKNHPSDCVAGGQKRRIYFGSPYARCGNEILFPTEPLLWPRLYGASKRAPNNHNVVFPCGIVRENENWIVSYGDDADSWLATFSTEEIFGVLKPL